MTNNSNNTRAILDINDIDNVIQDYMSKIANVELKGKSSPKDYVKAFQEAFGIEDHNFLMPNAKGILCYDLMICQNPLEEVQKQMFYTFFSIVEVYSRKRLLADVYTYYLEEKKNEHHIDTMLQIAYSEKKTGTVKEKVKEGFYLEFGEDKLRLLTTPKKGEERGEELSNFTIDKEIRKRLEKYTKRKALQQQKVEKTEKKTIENVFSRIEKELKDSQALFPDENQKTKFSSYIDAFLNEESSFKDGESGISQTNIHLNAYRIALINELAVPSLKRLYFIPVSFPGGKQIGHFVLSTDGSSTPSEERTIIDKFRVLSFVLLFPLSQINLSSIYIEKARQDSINSAKAAIMSRNMSHNLGSHVMFYIKQKLESVEKIMKTGALKELIKSQSIDELKEKINNKEVPGKEMPFLVGLGRFLNYLQERQDFIATVATNYIPYRTTVNFKDAIYDELKPEKHALRHKLDATGRKAANLLLDYIAFSEGFTSSDVIELWFGNSFSGGDKPGDVPTDLREFNIALPGGNLGRQAFFSIMENIIRNTAKHDGRYAINGKLQFQFDKLLAETITDGPIIQAYSLRNGEEKIRTTESENRPFDVSCYKDHENDFHYLGITIKLSEPVNSNTLRSLSKSLERDYITAEGLMDEECKGLKEIRISAAWLRGQELDSKIPSNEPPAVAIRKNQDGHLQYIICLPKPKKVACVVSPEKWDRYNETLPACGMDFFKFDSNNDSLVKEIANYEIVAVDNDKKISQSLFDTLQKNVGARIFWTKIDNQFSFNQAYSEWLKDAFDLKETDMPVISILDGELTSGNLYPDVRIKEKIKESGTSERRGEYFNNAIVFIRHYSGQPTYDKNARKVFKKARFIEAVSGGNTTFRLVRQDRRDNEWYVKQIAAGITKVAIFDERIYGMIMPEEKYEAGAVRTEVNNFFQMNALTNYRQQDIENIFKLFCKNVLIENLKFNGQLVRGPIYDELKKIKLDSSSKSNSTKVIKALSKYISIKDYSKAWKYREAGIWAFNIKVESDRVKIIGYNAPVRKQIGQISENYKEVEIAEIRKEGNKIRIVKLQMPKKEYKFDFITIHQGILDKIYTTLKIDKSEKGKTNRQILTTELFDKFSKLSNEKTSDNYLPQFIIHSGRSKPTVEDMPQKQPFLQFSALDHALRDCKYTLVELLNSAHYEESDNRN